MDLTTVYRTERATCPSTPTGMAQNITASVVQTTTVGNQSTVYASHPTGLPACDNVPSSDSSTDTLCEDTYGNQYNLAYAGRTPGNNAISTVAAPDVDGCLLKCDQTSGCLAIGFSGSQCLLYNSAQPPSAQAHAKRQNDPTAGDDSHTDHYADLVCLLYYNPDWCVYEPREHLCSGIDQR